MLPTNAGMRFSLRYIIQQSHQVPWEQFTCISHSCAQEGMQEVMIRADSFPQEDNFEKRCCYHIKPLVKVMQ